MASREELFFDVLLDMLLVGDMALPWVEAAPNADVVEPVTVACALEALSTNFELAILGAAVEDAAGLMDPVSTAPWFTVQKPK